MKNRKHGAMHHTHSLHLILILAIGELVGIPFIDHCELNIQSQEWMVCAVITCVILKHCCTVVPCWWWCKTVYMPIMTSAVLSGSHSVGLVPDQHGSVSESGNIEILATHVSHHYFVWVYFVSLKSSAPQRLLLVLGLTVKYLCIWTFASIRRYFAHLNIYYYYYMYSIRLL